jgi:hypothetical protein
MSDWKERLAGHVMKHLQRAQWEFKQKQAQGIGPSAPHMPVGES